MSLLGIDVGTSGCKAAVFSEDGCLLEMAYEEYDYQCPQPGEQREFQIEIEVSEGM